MQIFKDVEIQTNQKEYLISNYNDQFIMFGEFSLLI